jgi:hypothetical protein
MFKKGFEKVAGIMDTVKQTYKKIPAHHLDQAGLGAVGCSTCIPRV